MFYKNLLALRHRISALLDGDYVPLNENDPNVLSYLRRYKDEAVLVVLNMSANRRPFASTSRPRDSLPARRRRCSPPSIS